MVCTYYIPFEYVHMCWWKEYASINANRIVKRLWVQRICVVFTKGKQVPSTVHSNIDKINNIHVYFHAAHQKKGHYHPRLKIQDLWPSLLQSSLNWNMTPFPWNMVDLETSYLTPWKITFARRGTPHTPHDLQCRYTPPAVNKASITI